MTVERCYIKSCAFTVWMPAFSSLFLPFSEVEIILFKCSLQEFYSKHLTLYCTDISTLWLTESAICKVMNYNCVLPSLVLRLLEINANVYTNVVNKLVSSSNLLDCVFLQMCHNKWMLNKYCVHMHVFLECWFIASNVCVLLPLVVLFFRLHLIVSWTFIVFTVWIKWYNIFFHFCFCLLIFWKDKGYTGVIFYA